MNAKIIIHIFIGVLLRIIFYNSKLKETIRDFIFFPSGPYNYDNLKDNYFYNLLTYKIKESDMKIYENKSPDKMISDLLLSIYSITKDIPSDYVFIFFILLDIAISLILYNFKIFTITKSAEDTQVSDIKAKPESNLDSLNQKNEIQNEYILAIYLYNPISIIACVSFRLDIIYTFLNLLFAQFAESSLSAIILVIATIICPGYIFTNLIYLVYLNIEHFKSYRKTLFIFINMITFYIFARGLFYYDTMSDIISTYYNYYFCRDTKPNFGFIWLLLPSTFLKNQNYSFEMLIIYQFTLSIAIMLLVYRLDAKDYKYKNSLVYSLIFLFNHSIDRYPSELHFVIASLLVYQHFEIIKVKILNIAVYGSFMGFTLINFRGWPYTHRKTGSSNYLFFQNLTYDIALIFILMCCLNGIENIRTQKEKLIEDAKTLNKKNDNDSNKTSKDDNNNSIKKNNNTDNLKN